VEVSQQFAASLIEIKSLSGLFYLADRHYELFYNVSKQSQEKMAEFFVDASPEEKAEQEINLDSLTAYMQTKLPKRVHADPESVSEVVSELLEAGLRSIGDIDRLLDSAMDAVLLYEEEHVDRVKSGLLDLGVVRIAARIANDSYRQVGASPTMGKQSK
jgi:putative GTP pyrophosphokinase